jgi:hypothetical protein
MLKDKIIQFSILALLLISFACSKTEKKQTEENKQLKSLSDFVTNSKLMCDSIKKMKSYKISLLICTQTKTEKSTVITLTESCIPLHIGHQYYYKSIDGVPIVFYDYTKPLIEKEVQSNMQDLINKKIVKIEPNNNWTCCIPWFCKFAFCNDNPKEIKSFKNEQVEKIVKEYMIGKGGSINSDLLLTNCH